MAERSSGNYGLVLTALLTPEELRLGRLFPSSAEEGWLRGQKKPRSHLSPRRRGGVGQPTDNSMLNQPPRPRPSKEWDHFLEGAATPPLPPLPRRGMLLV